MAVAFLTPEMRQAQQQPWVLEPSVQPYAYVERLVVLADNARCSAVVQLQEHLLRLHRGQP